MEVRLLSDLSRGLVQKQIASVSVGFRTRPLWRNRLSREDTQRWKLQRLLERDAVEMKGESWASSAYCSWLIPWEDTIEATGGTKIVQRIGPKTKPCGKPQDGDKMGEEVGPDVTENDLFGRWDLSQLREKPMMPKLEVIRLTRITMVSKAALRSREREGE